MHHEALAVFAGERVDDLLVAPRAERDGHQGLRLATGEERGAVRAGKYPHPNSDRPHGARIAPIDARLTVEDLPAHDLRLEVEKELLHDVRIHRLAGHGRVGDQPLEHSLADLAQPRIARLLLLDA